MFIYIFIAAFGGAPLEIQYVL